MRANPPRELRPVQQSQPRAMSASDALASENKRLAEALERERKAAQFERELSREKISHLEQTVTELTRQSTNDAFQAARKCAPIAVPRSSLRNAAACAPRAAPRECALGTRRSVRGAHARLCSAHGALQRARGSWERHWRLASGGASGAALPLLPPPQTPTALLRRSCMAPHVCPARCARALGARARCDGRVPFRP